MVADDKEECFGTNQRHTLFSFVVALPSLILFGVVLPVGSFCFLYQRRLLLYSSSSLVFRYGLIYSGYAYSRWWWEITTIFRKVMLIVIVTFAFTDELQVHLALGVMVLLLYLQERARPYHDINIDNKQNIRKAPLHNLEILSFLLLIMMVRKMFNKKCMFH
jgi:hypothetical protein